MVKKYDPCVVNDRTSIKVDRRSDRTGKWRMLLYVYPQPGRILCGFGKSILTFQPSKTIR
jgi:hypothetical protein